MITDLSKFPIAAWREKLDIFLAHSYLEEAWIVRDRQVLGGTFAGDNPADISLEVQSDKYRFYCTSCDSTLCMHLLSLVDMHFKSADAFYDLPISELSFLEIEKRAWQKFFIKSKKSKNLVALKKKLELMLEGIYFAQQLVAELFRQIPKVSTPDELYELNNQIDRLSEFSLGGVRARFREVLMKNSAVLSQLATIMKGLKLSESVLKKQLSDDSLSYINSEAYTYLGHVWKITDLEVLSEPQAEILFPLYFHSYENVYFERLEDVQVWLCLGSMKVCYTQNLRPFKSLRHLKKQKESLDIIESKNVCFYPGKSFPRVRYKDSMSRQLTSEDLATLMKSVSSLTTLKVREVKKQLLNPFRHYAPVIFCKTGSLFNREGVVFMEGEDGEVLRLESCHSTEVLCSMTSRELEPSGLLLSFSHVNGRFLGRPLVLVNSLGVMRLSL
ncbi:MAG: hypothetical protein NE334_17905 [Lentisphaeraceae bacterium]|nr:hypothetical protein [Lentisphaeraceae bacterium]